MSEAVEGLDALNAVMGEMATGISSIAELRAFTASMAGILPTDLPDLAAVEDGMVVGKVRGRPVVADVARPHGDGPFPVLVYLHGGGWVVGSRVEYRPLAFGLAAEGFLVVNVDYPLAPEDPFPEGFDHCAQAVRWASEHAADHGGDPTRLVVAGDSAGANLTAAVAATFAADPTAPPIAAVLLFYGIYDLPSMPRGTTETSVGLADEMLVGYLGADRERFARDPRVNPLWHADRLPPSFVAVGGADELVEQSQQLVDGLAAAGIDHEHRVVPDMPHGFVQFPFPQAADTLAAAVRFARAHVG